MRRALPLLILIVALAAAAPAPAATKSKTKTATASEPSAGAPIVTAPAPTQPSGGAFGPVQGLAGQDTATTQTSINTKRPGDTGLGRGTLLLLVIVSFGLIIGVGVLIWYEGRNRREVAKRRRQRLRSGRTPQPHAVGGHGRRGPPPPPRKRRAQAAKRKKR